MLFDLGRAGRLLSSVSACSSSSCSIVALSPTGHQPLVAFRAALPLLERATGWVGVAERANASARAPSARWDAFSRDAAPDRAAAAAASTDARPWATGEGSGGGAALGTGITDELRAAHQWDERLFAFACHLSRAQVRATPAAHPERAARGRRERSDPNWNASRKRTRQERRERL